MSVRSATAAAPTAGGEAGGPDGPVSIRNTASGTRTSSSASKSPDRATARKASRPFAVRQGRHRLRERSPPHPPRTPLRELSGRDRERSTIDAISSNETPDISWSMKARRSAGVESLEYDEQRQADRIGRLASCAWVFVGDAGTTGSGTASTESSGRAHLAHSMSRQMRPTTVISQAAQVFKVPLPGPAQANQTPRTASSAPRVEPSIR